jgi:hypothetical protein
MCRIARALERQGPDTPMCKPTGERKTIISYGKTIENPNNISYKKWISLLMPLHDTVRQPDGFQQLQGERHFHYQEHKM